MEAQKGKRVKVTFTCRLEDGSVCHIADREALEFVVGQGSTLSSLETGIIGMKPGEQRTVRVPAGEARKLPLPKEPAPTPGHSRRDTKTSPGFGYDFAPGAGVGDDVYLTVPPTSARPTQQRPPAGADLFLEVRLIAVEDADR